MSKILVEERSINNKQRLHPFPLKLYYLWGMPKKIAYVKLKNEEFVRVYPGKFDTKLMNKLNEQVEGYETD